MLIYIYISGQVSNGFKGIGNNSQATEVMIASVRLLERAPYIYSYRLVAGPYRSLAGPCRSVTRP